MVESSGLGYFLVDPGVAAPLGVPGIDQGAHVGHLYEQLVRLARLLKLIEHVHQPNSVAEAAYGVEGR